jgi:Protein of unknown function (DUF3616)
MMTRTMPEFTLQVFVVVACAAFSPSAFAEKSSIGITIPVDPHYTAPALDKDGKARGISGMTCLGKTGDAKRECFVINDEETFGEVAILTDDGLKPTGKVLQFTRKGERGEGVLGTARDPKCGDEGKFGELDGEGVAQTADYIYVVSSHSCSGAGKYKPSSYLLVRFKPANSNSFIGDTPPAVERSWRVADALLASEVKSAYGDKKGKGTNIEGIAIAGERVYFGLRTPVTAGTAYIVSAPANDLFAPGTEALKSGVVKTRSLSLGEKTGIRDLAALENGGLLILSGPSVDQRDIGYKIWHLAPPISTSEPVELVTIETKAKAKDKDEIPKAEAITIIEQAGDKVVLIVNYDNVDEGAPSRHEINLKR